MSEPTDYMRAWAKLPELLFTWLDGAFFYLVRLCIMGGIISIIWGSIVELTEWSNGRRRILMGIILVAIGMAPELVGRF